MAGTGEKHVVEIQAMIRPKGLFYFAIREAVLTVCTTASVRRMRIPVENTSVVAGENLL